MKRKASAISEPNMVQTTTEAGPSSAKRPIVATMRLQSTTAHTHTSGPMSAQPEDVDDAEIQQPVSESTPVQTSFKATAESSMANTTRRIDDLTARLNPILPPGKVFSIRIGSELFQLSGASISSDGKFFVSYFLMLFAACCLHVDFSADLHASL
jgi:hypothetical protein